MSFAERTKGKKGKGVTVEPVKDDTAKYEKELKEEQEENARVIKEKSTKAMQELGKALAEPAKLPDPPAEIKVEDSKPVEEVTPEFLTSHPAMCDANLFGTYDPNNKECTVTCAEFSPGCAEACRLLMESRKVVTNTKPRTKNANPGVTRTRGGAKILLCGAESASGKCESLLCRPEGASMEEMTALRGAVSSLLNSLKKAGFNVVFESGRYYYKPQAPATV